MYLLCSIYLENFVLGKLEMTMTGITLYMK